MKTPVPLTVPLLVSCAFASAVSAAGTRADLDGVWLFNGAQIPEDPGLTAAGREKLEQYDPLRDDTDTICKPVTFTNIMHTPSPPIEIRLHGDHVAINYEFMDVHRRVPLAGALADAPYTVADHPHMGRSDRPLRGRGARGRHDRRGGRLSRHARVCGPAAIRGRCAPRSASYPPVIASRWS